MRKHDTPAGALRANARIKKYMPAAEMISGAKRDFEKTSAKQLIKDLTS